MLDNVVEMSMQSFLGTGIPKNVYLDQIISGIVVMFYENLSYCYVIVQLTMVSLDRRLVVLLVQVRGYSVFHTRKRIRDYGRL